MNELINLKNVSLRRNKIRYFVVTDSVHETLCLNSNFQASRASESTRFEVQRNIVWWFLALSGVEGEAPTDLGFHWDKILATIEGFSIK